MFETTPVIKLGDHFKKIQQFQKRFKKIPKIIELDHLTVTGDVSFGRNVTLRGTVIIVANEGQRIDIPDGCILENRTYFCVHTTFVFANSGDLGLLSGNLNMIVRLSQAVLFGVELTFFLRNCKRSQPRKSFGDLPETESLDTCFSRLWLFASDCGLSDTLIIEHCQQPLFFFHTCSVLIAGG